MSFQAIEYQMIVLFLAMALGFVARKLHVMSEESDKMLSRLVLTITLPCTILASVLTRDSLPDPATIGTILLFSCLAFALVLAIAFAVPLLFGLNPSKRGTYSFMLAFGNTGFLGYPVLEAVFGREAVLYGAIFNIPFNILVFTAGVMMLSQSERSLKEQVREGARNLISPSLIACLATMALALLNVTDIGVFGEAIDTMGSMTTSAALLIIGSSLATVPVKTMVTHFRTYIMAAFRLLIIPVCIWLAFSPFVADPLLLGVLVVVNGMPVATNGTILCLRYGGDLNTIIRGTFVTTALSLVTIPVLAALVGGV